MAYVIESESIYGNIQELGGIFPTTEEAMTVCEEVWNRYAPTEKFTRFSILDQVTREVYADYEC